jgi:hypothetical protein
VAQDGKAHAAIAALPTALRYRSTDLAHSPADTAIKTHATVGKSDAQAYNGTSSSPLPRCNITARDTVAHFPDYVLPWLVC